MASQPAVGSETSRSSEDSSQHAFDKLWNAALQRYKLETGKDPLTLPFADKFLDLSLTPDTVIQYIEEQNESFETFRTRGRNILRILKPIVHLVQLFIDAGAEGATASDVVTGGKAVFVAVGALLQAAKGVSELYDAIESLFKKVNTCLARVKIYLASPTPSNPALMDVLLRTFVQVFVIFGIVTKYCQQATNGNLKASGKKGARAFLRRMKDYVRSILGHSDVKNALEELEELTKEEHLLVAAHTNTLIRKIRPQVESLHKNAVIADVRSWLSPLNPKPTNYEKKRRTGSCEWFFDDRFEEWKAHPQGVFWVYGNAGAGKSILCSSIIDRLQADTTLQLFYFYFDSSDATKRDCLGLMSSLVFQLGTSRPECLDYLKSQHEEGKKDHLLDDHRPTYETLFTVLSQLLRISGRIYLVIDALDECPEYSDHNGLLYLLDKICALEGDNLRLLVTSRRELDIRRIMSSLATHVLSFHDDVHHKDDLKRHIHACISANAFDKWSDETKRTAQQVLFEKSNGMFVWVDLQLRDLKHCAPHDVGRSLDELPLGLAETYERILNNFPARTVMINRARYVFECIAFARRPLSVAEVGQLFFMKLDTPPDTPVSLDHEVPNVEDLETFVLESCPRFLDIVVSKEGHKTVQFIHFSVREYLTSLELKQAASTAHLYSFDGHSANTALARICLSALDVEVTRSNFLLYANEYWFEHVSAYNDNDLGGLLRHFLDMDSSMFTRWARIRSDICGTSGVDTALHLAARQGLSRLVEGMFDRSQSLPSETTTIVSTRGMFGRTALYDAAQEGHTDICRLLLVHGALVHAPDDQGSIALHLAAHYGHLDIVHVLLNHPATNASDATLQCRAKRTVGVTALHDAAREGYTEICRLLLEHGSLVHATDDQGCIALHIAAYYGRLDVIRVLLNHTATDSSDAIMQCRAKRTIGVTALHDAAQEGHTEVCRLLLEHGALVLDSDEKGSIALHIASYYGHLDVVRVLLNHPATDGSDATTQCRAKRTVDGATALHCAVHEGHAEICHILLKHGALVHDTDEQGSIALHFAAYYGHLDAVRVLLSYSLIDGSDAIMQCRAKRTVDGATALHDAARDGNTEICRLLLEHGALVRDSDEDGRNALHIAAYYKHWDLICVLLKLAATDDLHTALQCRAKSPVCGATVLHDVAREGHAEICCLLLKHGALVHATDDQGRIALHLAAYHGHTDVVHTLLNHPATDGTIATMQCRAKRIIGATALHDAASGGHTDICRLLLEHGALVHAADDQGCIALHIAAYCGHSGVVQVLLNDPATNGSDATMQCRAKRTVSMTALHDAAQEGHTEICLLLLKHGALAHDTDDGGRIALHLAAYRGHLDVVRVLLSHAATDGLNAAAPCHLRDSHGSTALYYAADGGHAGVVQILLDHGTIVDDVDDDGDTPLHLAEQAGHVDVVRILSEHRDLEHET